MKPRVLVTRDILYAGRDRLEQHCDITLLSRPPGRDELRALLPAYDAVLSMLTDSFDRETIAAAPKLRVISNYAVGFNNVDVAAATEQGIVVCNTPGMMTCATAEIAWALLMALARRIVEADAYVRSGAWSGWDPDLLMGVELAGKTMGIIGAGRIGLAIAKRAAAFEMSVLYHNRTRLPEHIEREHGLTYADLDTLLRLSDVVSLSCPYSAESHHLINEARLQQMKRSAFLINTARGPVVDEQALAAALRDGTIAGAGLDVFEREPEVHPDLLPLANVVMAPHLGSSTLDTRRRMAEMAIDNLLRTLQGEIPQALVNPDVWTTRRLNN